MPCEGRPKVGFSATRDEQYWAEGREGLCTSTSAREAQVKFESERGWEAHRVSLEGGGRGRPLGHWISSPAARGCARGGGGQVEMAVLTPIDAAREWLGSKGWEATNYHIAVADVQSCPDGYTRFAPQPSHSQVGTQRPVSSDLFLP